MTRYLIIGNSSGGIGAAEAIREIDRRGPLTIVSEEPYPAYSRPLIARYLAGETSVERMAYRRPEFYRQNDIDLVLGQRLVRLDLASRHAELDDGRLLPYDQLLLAVGGTPIVPPIEGLREHEFFTFATLDDARRLAARVHSGQRAIVVGGGLVGLSVTEALVRLGVHVTIVELAPQILGRALDTAAASLVLRAVEEGGVRVLTGRTVARVLGSAPTAGVVSRVELDDGSTLPCDLLIIAIGVRPRTEVVDGTGIAVQRGIIVDRHMATSCREVYACGDVAEAYDFIAGGNRLTPIWPNAYLGGRIAGRNMAGVDTVYSGGTAMNSLHAFGLSIMSAGIVDPPPGEPAYEVLLRDERARGTYRKITLLGGRVVGMIFAGEVDRAGIVFGLMRNGTPVHAFADRLLADDLGLLSLPAEVWQQMMRV
ncbi:MAG: FAD-dependent oxidoreductase [Anaerolineae bacterium]|nr:FAD-dependent oxidoreductase [Anaerolineae bacterium]